MWYAVKKRHLIYGGWTEGSFPWLVIFKPWPLVLYPFILSLVSNTHASTNIHSQREWHSDSRLYTHTHTHTPHMCVYVCVCLCVPVLTCACVCVQIHVSVKRYWNVSPFNKQYWASSIISLSINFQRQFLFHLIIYVVMQSPIHRNNRWIPSL